MKGGCERCKKDVRKVQKDCVKGARGCDERYKGAAERCERREKERSHPRRLLGWLLTYRVKSAGLAFHMER